MGERQHHGLALTQELRLGDPKLRVGAAEDGEDGVILRQRDREFNHAFVEKREIAAAAAWLRLIWIGVAVRRVVIETEPGHQVPPPLSGRGAESDRLPAVSVLSHAWQPFRQQPAGAQVAAIVPEAVDTDLAVLLTKPANRLLGDLVAQRHEVPRRPVAKRAFRPTQYLEAAAANIGFDVMRQH